MGVQYTHNFGGNTSNFANSPFSRNTQVASAPIIGDVVGQNRAMKSYSTLHTAEETSNRILEIQKHSLDQAVSIDKTNGNLLISSINISSIEEVLKNGAPVSYNGFIQLNGSIITIITRNIPVDADGDTYQIKATEV